MSRYMVDTNIINRILDHNLDLEIFRNPSSEFFVTHIQKDEIVKTPDINRRNDLLSIFNEISKSVSTESGLYGISKYGAGKYSSDGLVKKIRMELDKKEKRRNNPHDALIADTAIKKITF